jgi:phosphatidylethanolamine-binding protein (PEBP) family uncharacterized protein
MILALTLRGLLLAAVAVLATACATSPSGTRSVVILMDDPAGRAGLGVNHWLGSGIEAPGAASLVLRFNH